MVLAGVLGTSESQNATKKPHKIEKSAEQSADFNIKKEIKLFLEILISFLSVAFVLR